MPVTPPLYEARRIHLDDEPFSAGRLWQQVVCVQVMTLISQARANPGPSMIVTAKVARLIPVLNRGASPGPDGVTAERLIYGSSEPLFQAIASLFH